MIWSAKFTYHPPHGRIDGVVYYGGIPVPLALDLIAYDPATSWLTYWDGTGWVTTPILVPDASLSANVPVMTAGVLPAVDGSLLTNLPASAPLVGQIGTAYIGIDALDGGGVATPAPPVPIAPSTGYQIVACPNEGAGTPPAGIIYTSGTMIKSSLGGVDAGRDVSWVAVYY